MRPARGQGRAGRIVPPIGMHLHGALRSEPLDPARRRLRPEGGPASGDDFRGRFHGAVRGLHARQAAVKEVVDLHVEDIDGPAEADDEDDGPGDEAHPAVEEEDGFPEGHGGKSSALTRRPAIPPSRHAAHGV